VTLNYIKIKEFYARGGDPEADVFIRTFAQAETHTGNTAIFRKAGGWPAGWDDVPVGKNVNVGELIYHHFDCTPSEPLRVVVNVGDIDDGLGKVVKDLIDEFKKKGLPGGIVGGILEVVAAPIASAIAAQLDSMGPFEQEYTAPAPDGNPFGVGDNSGTQTLDRRRLEVYLGIGLGIWVGTRNFSANFTAQYIVHTEDCTPETLKQKREQVSEDTDDDGVVDATEDALGSDPAQEDSIPETSAIPSSCVDAIDNDLDGLIDFADPDCTPDADNDGLSNIDDNCPVDAEDFDGFEDEDGCPDVDNDRDEFLDGLDQCPNEPEYEDGVDDDDGCSEVDPPVAVQIRDVLLSVGGIVEMQVGGSDSPASLAGGSGSSSAPYAAIAGAAAAAALAVVAGALFARRRWVR